MCCSSNCNHITLHLVILQLVVGLTDSTNWKVTDIISWRIETKMFGDNHFVWVPRICENLCKTFSFHSFYFFANTLIQQLPKSQCFPKTVFLNQGQIVFHLNLKTFIHSLFRFLIDIVLFQYCVDMPLSPPFITKMIKLRHISPIQVHSTIFFCRYLFWHLLNDFQVCWVKFSPFLLHQF